MTRIAFLICICLGLASLLPAQEDYGTPEERARYQTDRMRAELPLLDQQVEAVHQLNLEYARRVQREVIDTGMNHFSAYFYMQKLIGQKEEELFPLLSARQIEQYSVLKSSVVKMLVARFFGG